MKIFITGASGFIGRNLTEHWKNHQVTAWNRHLDLFEQLLIANPDLVIHCAAEIYQPVLMWQANLDLTKTCLDYVKSRPWTKMIHIGSSSEYGPRSSPSAETDRINPVDMYQATKGMATLLCQGYARTWDLNVKIARPYSVYGRYEKPHRLFPRLWRAFNLDQPMTLFDGQHDFIYIDDFVRGLDILINDTGHRPGDIVNFGSGQQYSNLAVLEKFQQVTGRIAPVTHVPGMAKAFETECWQCDCAYAQSAYGFECTYDLESGIRDFLDTAKYLKEQP